MGGENASGGMGGDGEPALPPCDQADADGDGFFTGTDCAQPDCNDADSEINPEALELAEDGVDQDCTGSDLSAAAGPGSYVSKNDANCSDTHVGRGSKETPYCSISTAIAELELLDSPHLFVAHGTYSDALTLTSRVGIHGGYDPATWGLSDIGVSRIGSILNNSIIDAEGTEAESWVLANGAGRMLLERMTISGGKNTPSGTAVRVRECSRLTITHCDLTGPIAQGASALVVEATATGGVEVSYSRIQGGRGNGSGIAIYKEGGLERNVLAAIFNQGDLKLIQSEIFAVAVNGSGSFETCGLLNESNAVVVRSTTNAAVHGAFDADVTSGLCNAGVGTLYASGNVIYGGRGRTRSAAVRSYGGTITLVNNYLSGAWPEDASVGYAPWSGLFVLLYSSNPPTPVSFTLLNNAAFTRPFNNEGDISGYSNRYLNPYGTNIGELNACAWPGCVAASGNFESDPLFVDEFGFDFHLQETSPLLNAGVEPPAWALDAGVASDLDGDVAPSNEGWDIGIDERL
jgi:hypothetical protein